MFCSKLVFAKRYYAEQFREIETVFFALDASRQDFIDAAQKYYVNPVDFQILLDIYQANKFLDFYLLISVDEKYCSFLPKSAEWGFGELIVEEQLKVNFRSSNIEELNAEFSLFLFQMPTLFDSHKLPNLPGKIKKRIDYSQIHWGNIEQIPKLPALAIDTPELAPDDSLAIAVFQLGLHSFVVEKIGDPDPLLNAFTDRSLHNRWRGSKIFDFSGVTIRELAARRIRAENAYRALREQENNPMAIHDEPVYKRLRALKGDLLAETAFVAIGHGFDFIKDFATAVAERGNSH